MRDRAKERRSSAKIQNASALPALLFLLIAGAHSLTIPAAELQDVNRIEIRIEPNDIRALRTQSRKDAAATVLINDEIFSKVAVHLKGHGSFRGIDEKPNLTLTFNKWVSNQRVRGEEKVYLNNSVEDPSFLREWLGTELFGRAGIPAPSVSHADVRLTGRKLG